MAFQSLESRFNQKVKDLYNGATLKFEDGKPSTNRTADPLIVNSVGKGYWSFAEGRATPVISAARDARRLTLFTLSKRGILFLAKQQLLQTGNTFEHTRIINPAFAVANTVPFLHVKRNLRPLALGGPVGKLLSLVGLKNNANNNSPEELRKIAQLQQETYGKISQAVGLKYGASANISVRNLLQRIPVIGQTISAATAKRSMGEVSNGWTTSRPELNSGKYIAYLQIKKLNGSENSALKFTAPTPLQRALGVTVSTNPILDASPNAVIKNVFGMFNNVFPDRPASGPTTEQGKALRSRQVKYGPLNGGTTSGVFAFSIPYITYLKDKNTFTNTDYKRYVGNQYKILRGGNASYEAVPQELTANTNHQDAGAYTKIAFRQIENPTTRELSQRVQNYLKNKDPEIRDGSSVKFIKYFDGRIGIKSLTDDQILNDANSTNPQKRADAFRSLFNAPKGKISYVQDPLNTLNTTPSKNLQAPYNRLPTVNTARPNQQNDTKNGLDDIITVSFAMGNNDHVQFRAFVKDLVQEATPEYQKHQYIGRIEKFITYTSVQRTISFKLSVIAFSKDELPVVWQRINFLTGMVFPYGVNKGIFNPNIVRFTIGNVYTDQPAYITTMNTNFEDITTTWEISKGQQVPISATISMTFALIEKNSKTSASPFYNITETLQDQTGNNIFNKQSIGQSTEQSTPPRNTETEAIKAPEQTRTGGSQVTAGGLVADIENNFGSNPILPKMVLNKLRYF
jgi:hypothetical protein